MSLSEDDFLFDLTNGSLQGVSRHMENAWPEHLDDREIEECLNQLQELVHTLTGHAAYAIEIHTTDGHEHEASAGYPIAEGRAVPLRGTEEHKSTTANEMPGQVHVSDIKRICFRLH